MPGESSGAPRALRALMRTVDRLLERAYGPADWQPDEDPLGELIATILSQNTSDVNSHRAYASLQRRFPTWEAVLAAPRKDIEDAIRAGGLARTKSDRIQRILAQIAKRGPLNLDHLRALPDDEAERALLAYDGVGLKTARCVLLFSLGRDVFPVDTHIERILKRLGAVPDSLSADKTHRFIAPYVPKGRAYPMHIHLIAHGRRVCRPRKPECAGCVLRRLCSTDGQHS